MTELFIGALNLSEYVDNVYEGGFEGFFGINVLFKPTKQFLLQPILAQSRYGYGDTFYPSLVYIASEDFRLHGLVYSILTRDFFDKRIYSGILATCRMLREDIQFYFPIKG